MGTPKFDFEIPEDKKYELVLEDWKMSKDRISCFDNAVLTIRISGIPLVLVIIGVGFVIIDKLNEITIPFINCNGAILPFVFAALYTIPLCLLDALHYRLLKEAVEHAKSIENSKPFKDLLGITKALTSWKMTLVHTISLYALYSVIFFLCILLIIVFWNGIPPSLADHVPTNSVMDILK